MKRISLIILPFFYLSFSLDSDSLWKSGSADSLDGRILTFTCFVSAKNDAWMNSEKDSIEGLISEAQIWLVKQATKNDVTLSFKNNSEELVDDRIYANIIRNQNDLIERSKILFQIQHELGFTRKFSILDYMFDSTSCNKLNLLVFVKSQGTSYSLPFRIGMNKAKNFVEGSILFSQFESGKKLISSTIAHEMLHLYGAWDFYETFAQTKDRQVKANELFPNSIMLHTYTNINDNDVDELTSWLIGWNKYEKNWYRWFKPKNI
jgi:hypothetical protein